MHKHCRLVRVTVHAEGLSCTCTTSEVTVRASRSVAANGNPNCYVLECMPKVAGRSPGTQRATFFVHTAVLHSLICHVLWLCNMHDLFLT